MYIQKVHGKHHTLNQHYLIIAYILQIKDKSCSVQRISKINVENRMVASEADTVSVAALEPSQHFPWEPSSPCIASVWRDIRTISTGDRHITCKNAPFETSLCMHACSHSDSYYWL